MYSDIATVKTPSIYNEYPSGNVKNFWSHSFKYIYTQISELYVQSRESLSQVNHRSVFYHLLWCQESDFFSGFTLSVLICVSGILSILLLP